MLAYCCGWAGLERKCYQIENNMIEEKIILFMLREKILIGKLLLLLIFFLMFLFDVYFSGGDYRDKTIFYGLILGIASVIILRIKSAMIFSFSLCMLLLFGYNFFIHPSDGITERLSVWLFFSLVVGSIKQFFELRKR